MKKLFIFLFLMGVFYTHAQVINFPDANFKTKLLQCDVTGNNPRARNLLGLQFKIDANNNGEIEQSEALQVSYLFLPYSNVSSVVGIEYFTNMQRLFIHYNMISNVNLSALTQLISLRCDFNNLSTINFTGLTTIEDFNITFNNFTSLDVSNLPNLKYLFCGQNEISSLDFSNNPFFTVLQCRNNNLTQLVIKNGVNQDFSVPGFNDCWKTGNPNLTSICADASEIASVEAHLNGCGTPQLIDVNSNCNLSNEQFSKNSVVVFPNPTTSHVTITSHEIIKTVELLDVQGRLIEQVVVNNEQATIDLVAKTAGIYFIKITTTAGTKMEKLIKK